MTPHWILLVFAGISGFLLCELNKSRQKQQRNKIAALAEKRRNEMALYDKVMGPLIVDEFTKQKEAAAIFSAAASFIISIRGNLGQAASGSPRTGSNQIVLFHASCFAESRKIVSKKS